MIKKKICMLGVFAVGKTSLVQRFVKSMFSEKYLTTVGVKIDKKTIEVKGKIVELMLWDLQGEDEFQKLNATYLRGASGYFLVVDVTRASTLDGALRLKEKVDDTLGNVPFLVLLNKVDLFDQWELDHTKLKELEDAGWPIMKTSAKTGKGVEDAFLALALAMLEG
jgi:small GTP-binding protein